MIVASMTTSRPRFTDFEVISVVSEIVSEFEISINVYLGLVLLIYHYPDSECL